MGNDVHLEPADVEALQAAHDNPAARNLLNIVDALVNYFRHLSALPAPLMPNPLYNWEGYGNREANPVLFIRPRKRNFH